MKEYSLIGKYEAFELSDSGIIAELRTPTLYDSLELLRTVPETIIDKDPIGLTNMLYINKLYAKEKNDAGYVSITNRETLLKIIDNLSIDDAAQLEDAVSDRVDSNRITYSIADSEEKIEVTNKFYVENIQNCSENKFKTHEYQKNCDDEIGEQVLVNLLYAPNKYYIKYSTSDFKSTVKH
jgi:hypothetical protein